MDPSPDRMFTSAPDLRSARTACTSLALTAFVSGLSPLAPVTATNTTAPIETPHMLSGRDASRSHSIYFFDQRFEQGHRLGKQLPRGLPNAGHTDALREIERGPSTGVLRLQIGPVLGQDFTNGVRPRCTAHAAPSDAARPRRSAPGWDDAGRSLRAAWFDGPSAGLRPGSITILALMSAPASSNSFIVASTPSFVRLRPLVTRSPNSAPAAAISGVTPSLLGRSTSALCLQQLHKRCITRSRRAQRRCRALGGIESPPRSCGTSRYGGRRLSCRFGLAPFSSSMPPMSSAVTESSLGHRAIAPLPFTGSVLDVSRQIERRAAEQVPLVHVGACLDHERRELEVQVEQRHVERRDALGIFEVGIGAGGIRCLAQSTQPSRAA